MVTSYILFPNVFSNLESFTELVLNAIALDLILVALALEKVNHIIGIANTGKRPFEPNQRKYCSKAAKRK